MRFAELISGASLLMISTLAFAGTNPSQRPSQRPSQKPGQSPMDTSWFDKGKDAQKKHSFDLAIQDYRKSIEVSPQIIDAYINLALIFIDQTNYPEAQLVLKQAKTQQPKNREVLHTLGLVYMKAGRFSEALATAQSILNLDPKDQAALTLRNQAKAALSPLSKLDEKNTEKILSQQVKASSKDLIDRYKLAEFKIKNGEVAAAIPLLLEVLKIQPDNGEAYALLSYAYNVQGHYQLSIDQCEKGSLFFRAQSTAKEACLVNESLSYWKLIGLDHSKKSHPKAIEWFQKVIDDYLGNPGLLEKTLAHVRLARIYLSDSNFAYSIRHFEKALALPPTERSKARETSVRLDYAQALRGQAQLEPKSEDRNELLRKSLQNLELIPASPANKLVFQGQIEALLLLNDVAHASDTLAQWAAKIDQAAQTTEFKLVEARVAIAGGHSPDADVLLKAILAKESKNAEAIKLQKSLVLTPTKPDAP